LIESLQDVSRSSQQPILDFLLIEGVEGQTIRKYWIENIIYADVSEKTLEKLMKDERIMEIGLETEIQTIQAFPKGASILESVPASVESGLERIKAPFMWEKGYTGYGTKIFVIDSGTDPFHQSLKRQNAWHNNNISRVWIGTNGENFTYDCESHGTHVTGTAVGLYRENEDTIGVAFNAEWMAGNPIGCNDGFPQNTIIEMFQWALNPDNNSSTTDDIPNVINNSWGDFSLGSCSSIYRNALIALENADIAVMFSAGNEGPGDRTISPPANLEINPVNPMSIGALTTGNNVADFSSRGPSRCLVNGERPVKPEVSAPGVNVRSSIPGNKYTEQQGTSMASPHVAGAYLLLKEAFPSASSRELKEALYYSASDIGIPGEDDDSGLGIIDLEASYNYLLVRGFVPIRIDINEDLELWNVIANEYACGDGFNSNVLLYNGGETTITSARIEMRFDGSPFSNVTNWTGRIAPGEQIWVTLDPIDLPPGNYTLIVRLIDVNNNGADERPLNDRMKQFVNIRDESDYSLELHDTFGDLCPGSRVAISVEDVSADRYNWYASIPLESVIATDPYINPEVSTIEETFYVVPIFEDQIGMEVPSESELLFGYSGGKLNFDVDQPFRLKTFDIYSETPGSLGFLIRSGSDTVFQTAGYFATGGLQTIPINRTIPAGNNYEIILYNNPGLGYAASNVSFPYRISPVINIDGSTPPLNGEDPYYYFFNWSVEYDHPCGFKEVTISPTGAGNIPRAAFDVNKTEFILPGDATLIGNNRSSNSDAYLWEFGDGNSSSSENVQHTFSSPGSYNLVMTARSASNCIDAEALSINVEGMSNNNESFESNNLLVFPNPAQNSLTVNQSFNQNMKINKLRIINAMGVEVFKDVDSIQFPYSIDLSNLPAGVYILNMNSERGEYSYKIMKR
jgi:subtilisin family serine protease/PKD repeat protein